MTIHAGSRRLTINRMLRVDIVLGMIKSHLGLHLAPLWIVTVLRQDERFVGLSGARFGNRLARSINRVWRVRAIE